MPYYNRKRNRLKNYSYSNNGMYFVTICTKDKQKILSHIENEIKHVDGQIECVGDGVLDVPKKIKSNINKVKQLNNVGDGFSVPRVQLTKYGKIVDEYIKKVNEKYNVVKVDKYVIMPNHIHLLLSIMNEKGTEDPSPTISAVIGWLKYNITKDIDQKYCIKSEHIFQRSFHDHIVRNKYDYEQIWKYIEANPSRWQTDCFFIE